MAPDRTVEGNRLDRRRYLHHFTIVLTGHGAAQVLNLLAYPILARLYSPQDFGTFAMFVAVSAIVGTVACARFDIAVPTAPRWGRFAVLWLCILLSAMVAFVSIGGAELWRSLSHPSVDGAVPFLFGFCVFLTGLSSAQSFFLMRHDRYRAAAASMFVRTGAAVASQVALAFLWATSLSLIIGFTLGLVAQAMMLTAVIWRRVNPGLPKRRDLRAMFLRFRRQVLVDVPSTFVSALSDNLLTLLLAGLYDQRTVGFFSLGNRIAIAPLQLFNNAAAQTFFQKAARARDQKGHFWEELKFSLTLSALFSALVLVAILLFARPFINIYLGSSWSPSADMLIVLAPMLAIRTVVTSIGTTAFVLRSAHWQLVHNLAAVTVTLAACLVAMIFNLGVMTFLAIAATLLSIEFAVFGAFLVRAARRARA